VGFDAGKPGKLGNGEQVHLKRPEFKAELLYL
jgi:hypothetical protein